MLVPRAIVRDKFGQLVSLRCGACLTLMAFCVSVLLEKRRPDACNVDESRRRHLFLP